ncbi:MAG TPA: hypothetical protein DDW34_00745 [Clostridium sp.]|nr:hypothetical protein [Clostridium sp.]
MESSIEAVSIGTKIADATAISLSSVVTGASEINTLMNVISQASNEQATSIGQVTRGVEQISEVIQTNSATAEESAAASEELSGQAQLLITLVSNFKLRDMYTENCLYSNENTMSLDEENHEYKSIDNTRKY